MNYYRRYLGDYTKKTTRLSMLEHGAYSMMLDAYYIEEAPLPLAVDEIYDICKARTPECRAAVDKVLGKYFKKQKDGWHNKRADEEIAAAQTARDNGSKGGRPKTHKETQGVTRDETTDITTEGGRNGTSTNHHPPTTSLSTTQPPTATPGAEPDEHQVASMRGAMSKALRDEGVTGSTPSAPDVVDWVNRGVTIQQIREAIDLAREQKPKPEAIPIRYLKPIVERLLAKPATVSGNGSQRGEWWGTADGIKAKAREVGIEPTQAELTEPGGILIVLKCRIAAKIGRGPWVDPRNATELRCLEHFEREMAA